MIGSLGKSLMNAAETLKVALSVMVTGVLGVLGVSGPWLSDPAVRLAA
jgi:hypothetical protein